MLACICVHACMWTRSYVRVYVCARMLVVQESDYTMDIIWVRVAARIKVRVRNDARWSIHGYVPLCVAFYDDLLVHFDDEFVHMYRKQTLRSSSLRRVVCGCMHAPRRNQIRVSVTVGEVHPMYVAPRVLSNLGVWGVYGRPGDCVCVKQSKGAVVICCCQTKPDRRGGGGSKPGPNPPIRDPPSISKVCYCMSKACT